MRPFYRVSIRCLPELGARLSRRFRYGDAQPLREYGIIYDRVDGVFRDAGYVEVANLDLTTAFTLDRAAVEEWLCAARNET